MNDDNDLIARRKALRVVGVFESALNDSEVMLWSAGEVIPALRGWRERYLPFWVKIVRAYPEVAKAIVYWSEMRRPWTLEINLLTAYYINEENHVIDIVMERIADGEGFYVIGQIPIPSGPGKATSTHAIWCKLESMLDRLDRLISDHRVITRQKPEVPWKTQTTTNT